MIRQKYELMIKKEEKEKRQKDRERCRQLDEITKEPSMQLMGIGAALGNHHPIGQMHPIPPWQGLSASTQA